MKAEAELIIGAAVAVIEIVGAPLLPPPPLQAARLITTNITNVILDISTPYYFKIERIKSFHFKVLPIIEICK